MISQQKDLCQTFIFKNDFNEISTIDTSKVNFMPVLEIRVQNNAALSALDVWTDGTKTILDQTKLSSYFTMNMFARMRNNGEKYTRTYMRPCVESDFTSQGIYRS